MPTRAPTFRASAHESRPQRQQRYDTERGTSHQRGYDRAWQRCRAAFLAHEPLCRRCARKGTLTVATEVHHIVPLHRAPERRLDWSNLLPACHACHMWIEANGGGDPLG